jgi:hypothetical protein
LIGKAGESRRPGAAAFGIGLLAPLVLACGARGGETRCWIDKGALVAPAAFGDIAGDFLIDLSAPASALHVTRAREDGLEGEAATRDLTIAGRRLSGITLPIVDLDAHTARFDTTINGVIGADVLRRFVVEIDPSPCRLRLLRRGGARWAGSVRLPIREAGGRPLVPARVTDGVRVRSGLFALATAEWTTQVAGRLARPQAAETPAPVRLRAVEVAGRLFEQVPAAAPPLGSDGAIGAIGVAVWSQWRLRLDVRHGWLDLASADPFPLSSPRKRSKRMGVLGLPAEPGESVVLSARPCARSGGSCPRAGRRTGPGRSSPQAR